jgi:nucleotide-binding universal stress UspA family protein
MSNRSVSADHTRQEKDMSSALRHPPVVVGVDGSPTSGAALRWAIHEASTRRIPLHLVSAWNPSYDLDTLGLATRTVEDHCRAILDAAREMVTAADPTIEVTSTTYVGPPTTSLVDASLHADTVVIGSRGRRALRGFLLGATSLEVAAHAASPVVVVRENALPDASSRKVVVGVDGSPRSSDAVAYAFAYASANGLDLTVLHAFQVEYVSGVISKLSAEESNARLAQEELALTSETVAGWQEKYPDVHVHTVTLRAHSVDALVNASKTANLLVIGGRRRGRIGGALLGAVGHGVLHDAHCPVAVVRAQQASGGQHR